MVDNHFHPQNWGIRPELFNVGGFSVPSYSFFVILALAAGILIYFYDAKRNKSLTEKGFFIALGALAGGIIGAKVLQWIIDFRFILSHFSDLNILLSGRTIVGGLIGGAIGATITKRVLGIKEKRGNLFAPAIALGVAVGRIGCFLQGCCYGRETSLPWGVNFGDGVMRHPTQIYEALFMFGMFVYLELIKNHQDIRPGQLFKILMISYFVFRFLIEFIRVSELLFLGLTSFQLISIGVIIYLSRGDIARLINKMKAYGTR